MSGGDPVRFPLGRASNELSPHEWGWSYIGQFSARAWRAFPTWVGVIPDANRSDRVSERFPHMSGGDPARVGGTIKHVWLSPHEWGWSSFWQYVFRWQFAFPTWVGVILVCSMKMLTLKCFPHMSEGDPKKAIFSVTRVPLFSFVLIFCFLLPVSLFIIANQVIVNRRLRQVVIADPVINRNFIKDVAVHVLHPEHVMIAISQVA